MSFASGVRPKEPKQLGNFPRLVPFAMCGALCSDHFCVDIRLELLARLGLVRTLELHAIGENDELIRIARNYGAIVSVRRGWWALPGTAPTLLRAWRAGGRLACVSALAFHGETSEQGEPLHIELPARSRGARSEGVVVHWSRDQRNGDRRAVSVEVAARQASRCRAAAGTLAAANL